MFSGAGGKWSKKWGDFFEPGKKKRLDDLISFENEVGISSYFFEMFGSKKKLKNGGVEKLPPHIKDEANQCIIDQRALIHQRTLLYKSARFCSFSFRFLPLFTP